MGVGETYSIFALIKVRDKAATRATNISEVRYEIETRDILAKRESN